MSLKVAVWPAGSGRLELADARRIYAQHLARQTLPEKHSGVQDFLDELRTSFPGREVAGLPDATRSDLPPASLAFGSIAGGLAWLYVPWVDLETVMPSIVDGARLRDLVLFAPDLSILIEPKGAVAVNWADTAASARQAADEYFERWHDDRRHDLAAVSGEAEEQIGIGASEFSVPLRIGLWSGPPPRDEAEASDRFNSFIEHSGGGAESAELEQCWLALREVVREYEESVETARLPGFILVRGSPEHADEVGMAVQNLAFRYRLNLFDPDHKVLLRGSAVPRASGP